MRERHRTALWILGAGLGLGGLADATLRVSPWGLNASLTAVALLLLLLALQRWHGTPAGPGRYLHVAAAVALAAGLIWRDAVVLKALDVLGLIVVLGLLAAERRRAEGCRTLSGYVARVGGSALQATIGVPLLLGQDVSWSGLCVRSTLALILRLGRGLALAIPALVVFALLLGGADPVFAARLREIVDVDVFALIAHLWGISCWAWLAVGLLRAAVLRAEPESTSIARPSWLRLGTLEMGLLLGLLDLLFGSFVWIQVRYLFGGAACIHEIAGLTYSEYARSGFFQLVWVVALALSLLLLVHWLLPAERAGAARVFAVLGGLQIALVLVILVSALERMRLYQAEYGQTQLRLYTTAFMMWMGALLVAFAATVLRGRREAFARFATASSLAAVLLLHAGNPEEWIVAANRQAPHGFDAAYATGLSADAVPELVAVAEQLDGEPQRRLAQALLDRWSQPDEPDWRSWSLARSRARRCVAEAESELRAVVESR